jgi:hypothetical protein
MPVLDWLLRINGVVCAINGQWAELRWLRLPPTGLAARISKSVALYPCELLFIHRDAEAEPHQSREEEITRAVNEATFDFGHRPRWVCIIPVRMREAWLLFDEPAIRGRREIRQAVWLCISLRSDGVRTCRIPRGCFIICYAKRAGSGLGGEPGSTLVQWCVELLNTSTISGHYAHCRLSRRWRQRFKRLSERIDGITDDLGLNRIVVFSFPIHRLPASLSITINANVPGRTGPLRAPAGAGPNFAETTNTR